MAARAAEAAGEVTRAAALVIGNEILAGRTPDTNSAFLARELRRRGIELRRILVVPDEEEDIAAAVQLLAPGHDIVFTSGGVGPTHDDVTLAAVARGLGRKLVRNREMEALVKRYHGEAALPAALRMADLPEGAELVRGADLESPVVAVANLYILPGVPALFERKVLALGERLRGVPYHLRTVYLTAEEVDVAALLDDLARRHPRVSIGSYPDFDSLDHRVKVTLEGRDEVAVATVLDELVSRLEPAWLRRVESPSGPCGAGEP